VRSIACDSKLAYDFSIVLDAERVIGSYPTNWIAARLDGHRLIAVYKALGGGWELKPQAAASSRTCS